MINDEYAAIIHREGDDCIVSFPEFGGCTIQDGYKWYDLEQLQELASFSLYSLLWKRYQRCRHYPRHPSAQAVQDLCYPGDIICYIRPQKEHYVRPANDSYKLSQINMLGGMTVFVSKTTSISRNRLFDVIDATYEMSRTFRTDKALRALQETYDEGMSKLSSNCEKIWGMSAQDAMLYCEYLQREMEYLKWLEEDDMEENDSDLAPMDPPEEQDA